ncbi:MAG TPA: hypothetical protein VE964_16015 [Myxococcales bacterium]|nr:hypothetical protein [Myxococcales bacterium]
MKQENIWRLPATLFLVGILAMLLAGAWRELEAPARRSSAVALPDAGQEEPPSNEIPDFQQLD